MNYVYFEMAQIIFFVVLKNGLMSASGSKHQKRKTKVQNKVIF